MSGALDRIRRLQEERDRREREGVFIYRPSFQQEPIHHSGSTELLVRGGKRSGKTVSTAVEYSRRVTGQDIHGSDGKVIPNPWPVATPDFPRIYWIIGWDTKHIGQTIHKILFEPGMGGQYRSIQDEHTGQWRTWNRANPVDVKRISESVLAEPLIPERLIIPDSWSWEEKRSNQFSSVELINGAKIFAFPSTQRQAKQGDAVSGIWIDEDIVFPGHLKEWQDRLTDESGWFLWSVWPHMKNEALLTLLERAEVAQALEKPQIASFQLVMTDNPFLTRDGKEQSLGRMGTDEEVARRNRGELMMDTLSMYGFEAPVHSLRRRNPDAMYEPDHPPAYEILRNLWEELGAFPREWTRYLSVDPSHTRTAAHSWVIPPREINGVDVGDIAIGEWELIARRLSAGMFAKEIRTRMASRRYEAFIMDKRAGRQTHAGRDENTNRFYASAFRECGIMSRQTGYGFLPGCDVPQTRYRAVRDLLEVQPQVGIPSLMIVEERCIETKREFGKYRKKTEMRGEGMDSVLDEPANPRMYDAMASMEYFAAYIQPAFMAGTAFVDPSVYAGRGSPAFQHAKKLLAKQQDQEDGLASGGVVNLGPDSYTSIGH